MKSLSHRENAAVNPVRVPLVFQGGGVLGTAFIGAIKALEELNILPSALAGASAGAIICALLAVGYSADELLLLMKNKEFCEFLDPVCHIPGIRLLLFYLKKGIYKGDHFYEWLVDNLSIKMEESPIFADIPIPLFITATDITRKKQFVASQSNSKVLPVADAVRMSMSLPFLFVPVKFGSSEIVDGGVVNNYPAPLLRQITDKPILGFRLQSGKQPSHSRGWFDLAGRLMDSAIGAAADYHQATVKNLYTVHLPTLGIGVTDFGITKAQKLSLYQAGRHATLAFFSSGKGREFLRRSQQ
ncbi:patatin-like phospholipase family protein [Calothrix sp. FACHB-1219]|uniref:patatin-like phospholipase family protein n=1 Tax=unclassified Calothrix TaxID=2619626 RepID=UPI001683425A|nr:MULTISPECIES: patatin-like phospholipase family protein [unclassified Calothrix]MBD2207625.1 patatin-like phospholipase family protein [Calothrix sp. FACHB-168]MBD2222226.1 patatin-like phospholipase family protein [Calothrix sp. FACHB-1219]